MAAALRFVVTGLLSLLMLCVAASLRLLHILSSRLQRDPRIKYPRTRPSHMIAVLGSGGHTSEMISLLRNVTPTRYIHRTYIVSSGDKFSAGKALDIETAIQLKQKPSKSSKVSKKGELDPVTGKWDVEVVPRARKIHQSLITAPISSIWCLMSCIATLRKISTTSIAAPDEYPDLIITNGPATAVMVILASFLLKFFGLAPVYKMKIVYVESWARVKTLSLSGEVLLRLGLYDEFWVQWEELAKEVNNDMLSLSGKVFAMAGFPNKFVVCWDSLLKKTFSSWPKQKVEWDGFLVE